MATFARQALDEKSRYTFPRDVERLGNGTYGVVYRAVEKGGDHTPVAYKALYHGESTNDYSSGIPEEILREVAALKTLDHPNVVKLRDIEYLILPGGPNIGLVFDMAGANLHQLIAGMRDRRRDADFMNTVKEIMYHLLDGVHHIHSRGFLHGDLKPTNILVTEEGRLMVADFGSAQLLPYSMDIEKYNFTFYYKAPETFLSPSRFAFASDVWSIGCIFAQVITGEYLFDVTDSDYKENADGSLLMSFETILGVFDTDPDSVNYFPGIEANRHYRTLGKPHLRAADPVRRVITDPLNGGAEATLGSAVIGEDAADLMRQMLIYDPSMRITCREAKKHRWFSDMDTS